MCSATVFVKGRPKCTTVPNPSLIQGGGSETPTKTVHNTTNKALWLDTTKFSSSMKIGGLKLMLLQHVCLCDELQDRQDNKTSSAWTLVPLDRHIDGLDDDDKEVGSCLVEEDHLALIPKGEEEDPLPVKVNGRLLHKFKVYRAHSPYDGVVVELTSDDADSITEVVFPKQFLHPDIDADNILRFSAGVPIRYVRRYLRSHFFRHPPTSRWTALFPFASVISKNQVMRTEPLGTHWLSAYQAALELGRKPLSMQQLLSELKRLTKKSLQHYAATIRSALTKIADLDLESGLSPTPIVQVTVTNNDAQEGQGKWASGQRCNLADTLSSELVCVVFGKLRWEDLVATGATCRQWQLLVHTMLSTLQPALLIDLNRFCGELIARQRVRAEQLAIELKHSKERLLQVVGDLPFQVHLHLPVGRLVQIDGVTLNTPVAQLKEKMESQAGVPAYMTNIIFNGRQLNDQKTLAYYDISAGSIVRIALRWNNMREGLQ